MNEHLRFSSKEIDRDRVRDVFEKSRELVHDFGFQFSKIKVGHNNNSLQTKSITTTKLLIKYHKNPSTNGEFSTRLVISETNFTATLAKVGYLSLKEIIDNHQVYYKKCTITQA